MGNVVALSSFRKESVEVVKEVETKKSSSIIDELVEADNDIAEDVAFMIADHLQSTSTKPYLDTDRVKYILDEVCSHLNNRY